MLSLSLKLVLTRERGLVSKKVHSCEFVDILLWLYYDISLCLPSFSWIYHCKYRFILKTMFFLKYQITRISRLEQYFHVFSKWSVAQNSHHLPFTHHDWRKSDAPAMLRFNSQSDYVQYHRVRYVVWVLLRSEVDLNVVSLLFRQVSYFAWIRDRKYTLLKLKIILKIPIHWI